MLLIRVGVGPNGMQRVVDRMRALAQTLNRDADEWTARGAGHNAVQMSTLEHGDVKDARDAVVQRKRVAHTCMVSLHV